MSDEESLQIMDIKDKMKFGMEKNGSRRRMIKCVTKSVGFLVGNYSDEILG